jgi:hypothetical protein
VRQLFVAGLLLGFAVGCSSGGSSADAGAIGDGGAPQSDAPSVPADGALPPGDAAGAGDAGCAFPIDASGPFQPADSGVVPLTAQTISSGAFFTWIAQTPSASKATVMAQIAAGNTSANVAALNARLSPAASPVTDLTDEFMLLAVVGQLRDPSSIGPLVRLVWLPPKSIFDCKGSLAGTGEIDVPDCDAIIRARVTEMLAYIEATSPNNGSLSDVLGIASTHPSVLVRRAAMDAYLFNMGDSPDAAATLRASVQGADTIFVDRARFTASMDGGSFDRAVTGFYNAHAAELPPAPAAGGTDAGVTHSTCP